MSNKLKVGDQFGQWTLKKFIKGGGNGEVWRASSSSAGEAALKVLRSGSYHDDSLPRFKREVSALSNLKDLPGVLPLIDHCDFDSATRFWFTMPIAIALLDALGKAELERVCEAVRSFADTLAKIHSRGMSHRDIKPGNLFWWKDQWCLGDFGLVRMADIEPLTADAQKLGPIHYIAPEMLNDPVSSDGAKADIYSLGKVLWTIATGQKYPMPGEQSPAVAAMTISSYVTHRRVKILDSLLYRMTRHEPELRPTAANVATELTAWLSPVPESKDSPDLSATLSALRSAIEPHRLKSEEQSRKNGRACALLQRVRVGIDRLTPIIRDQMGLPLRISATIPNSFEYRDGLGHSRKVYKDCYRVSFQAGGTEWAWRLSIVAAITLFEDDQTHIAAGYVLDRLFKDKESNCSGQHWAWSESEVVELDGPLADDAVTKLINGLTNHFPAELKVFTEHVESVPLRD